MSIGGTSGAPAGTGNTLSMNLGGVNVNYDLGPSTSTVASQAYDFLNNSFQQDQAFTGAAIFGANSLISGLASPLIAGAADQLKQNATVVPDLFSQMEQNNYNLGLASIQTQADIAQSSIASSQASAQAASSAGGGCYVTSAVCETLGLPDDCHTLKTLRHFRDTYMMGTNVRRAFVHEYYQTAPALVGAIRRRDDAREFLGSLYERFILPALLAIEGGRLDRAFKIYRQMLYYVRAAVGSR
jgi:hypothetical protein